ncbi:MAG TPA: rhodanese-like domain-containing protein [Thermoanaerobaculia bacterium]|nr:rhodanese-like domain-containing protein [Thermoanaerobaculia bacterium]
MATKTNSSSSPQPPEQQPSRGPILVLAAGSIAVAALVGWALTRTVEPLPPAVEGSPAAPIGAPQTAGDVVPTTPAATTPATNTAGEEDGIARLGPDQLKDLVDRGSVTVLDVRDSVAYTNGHIPGAINIPFARVQAEASKLPKGRLIVAYCT